MGPTIAWKCPCLRQAGTETRSCLRSKYFYWEYRITGLRVPSRRDPDSTLRADIYTVLALGLALTASLTLNVTRQKHVETSIFWIISCTSLFHLAFSAYCLVWGKPLTPSWTIVSVWPRPIAKVIFSWASFCLAGGKLSSCKKQVVLYACVTWFWILQWPAEAE